MDTIFQDNIAGFERMGFTPSDVIVTLARRRPDGLFGELPVRSQATTFAVPNQSVELSKSRLIDSVMAGTEDGERVSKARVGESTPNVVARYPRS